MGKKQKYCKGCNQSNSTMYRCRVKKSDQWDFYCYDCMKSLREKNPDYQYGGTWKLRD